MSNPYLSVVSPATKLSAEMMRVSPFSSLMRPSSSIVNMSYFSFCVTVFASVLGRMSISDLVVAGRPVVLECVPILACDCTDFLACKGKCRVVGDVGHHSARATLGAGVKMFCLLGAGLQFGHARFQRFQTCRKVLQGLPDGCFVEDFQNV